MLHGSEIGPNPRQSKLYFNGLSMKEFVASKTTRVIMNPAKTSSSVTNVTILPMSTLTASTPRPTLPSPASLGITGITKTPGRISTNVLVQARLPVSASSISTSTIASNRSSPNVLSRSTTSSVSNTFSPIPSTVFSTPRMMSAPYRSSSMPLLPLPPGIPSVPNNTHPPTPVISRLQSVLKPNQIIVPIPQMAANSYKPSQKITIAKSNNPQALQNCCSWITASHEFHYSKGSLGPSFVESGEMYKKYIGTMRNLGVPLVVTQHEFLNCCK